MPDFALNSPPVRSNLPTSIRRPAVDLPPVLPLWRVNLPPERGTLPEVTRNP